MKYFVYYHDDWYELGGVGLEQFETEQAALDFILLRLRYGAERTLSDYTLIKGEEINVVPAEKITVLKTEG